ncbi:MAG TPA: ABC-F family ATP-binding cassette domain-containing protein [Thermoflexales bacterium]|nr:ABC-F family ATP-binding cassette domain-containing protein [Thermoflexales bacterium]
MSVLTGSGLTRSYGAFDVFTDISVSVAQGDKIALVGPNGCGKTTLLRILAGVDEPSRGQVNVARDVSRGYLAQTAEDANDFTIWEECQEAFGDLTRMGARLAALELAMAQPETQESALAAYGPLQHTFEARGGYTIDTQIKRVLTGLGFKPGEEHKRVAVLSGGQRVRAALARLLLEAPDILFLDEPTNHLDTQGIEWLESYLQDWPGTIIVVSHDRYFMDEVAERIWEMQVSAPSSDSRQVLFEAYRGGYTDYVAQREERRERQTKEFDAQREVIAKQEEYIRRNMAGQNTAQAKGRLKRLNRLERLEKPIEQRVMSLRMAGTSRSGNIVLETHGLRVGYRDAAKALFSPPNLQLLRLERAALVGPNGTGKTTLLKTILGDLEPLAGTVKIGAAVKVGYFAQAHEGLDVEKTPLNELLDASPGLTLPEARNLLGRFLFSGDDVFKKIGALSGGERGRVALAKLTLQGANLLLLDEPTNHLDIPAQEILTEALNHFDGTMLVVSHDRYLIAALATQIWSLEPAGDGSRLSVFRGPYDAWIESKQPGAPVPAPAEAAKTPSSRPASAKSPAARNQPPPTPPPPPSAAASKNRERSRLRQLEQAEARIATLERKLSELNWEMEVHGADYEKLRPLMAEYAKIEKDLEAAWAEIERIG